MEARQTLRGSSISKTFVAIVLILVAVGLGVMGAYVAQSFSGSHAATSNTIPAAPGTSIRKNFDNYPAQPAASQPTRPLHVE